MKQFFYFVQKEFVHIFRDWRTMLILLGMPIAQMLLFGFALTTELKNVRLAVCDLSKDVTTRQIIDKFQANRYFDYIGELENPNEADRILQRGEADMVIVFDSEFQDNMLHTGEASLQLLVDASDPNQGTMMMTYASEIVRQYQQETSLQYQVPFLIIPQVRMLYNPLLEGAYNFVPGVMGLILMLICAMMTSISIVREKEKGSMEVLLVSPVKPIYIILSKAVPYFTLSVVNLSTILLLSYFVLKVPIAGNLLAIILISFLFILVALLLGLMISNVVHTQVAAMLISGMGMLLPTMLLSGLIFPIESMPAILQGISAIVPARWYIEAIKKLMIQGVDVIYVWKECVVLISMALVLLVVSLKKFNVRLG